MRESIEMKGIKLFKRPLLAGQCQLKGVNKVIRKTAVHIVSA